MVPNFRPPRLAELYAQRWTADTFRWRALGARDKVRNIERVVAPVQRRIHRVLEVGCGTGVVLNALSRTLGTELVGIDVSDENGHREPPASPAVRFEIYDGAHVPFDDCSFDLVYATHVLEHVLDEREFLHELRRVARGYIYVEVPCELHVRTSIRMLQQSLEIGHVNAYTPESLALTLETSGLEVLTLQVFDHSYALHRFHMSPVKALAKTALRRSLLSLSEHVATRVFTYHAAALCQRAPLI